MANNQIAYVELPTTDIAALRTFYAELFGWTFFNLGDDYAVFQNAGVEGGINPNKNDRTKSPLVLIESDDAEGMQDRIRAAGITILVPLFDYPGGKRFHFLDPSGNEMGVFQKVPETNP